MQARRTVLILCVAMFGLAEVAAGQKAYPRPPGSATTPAPAATTPATPADQTAAPAQTAMPAPAVQATTPPPAAQTETENPAPTPPPAKNAKGAKPAKGEKPAKVEKVKAKKEVYSGPTEIVVLPPSEMLDLDGKPSLDPDGKPILNAPQKQQRDKKGHPMFDAAGKPIFQTDKELGYDEKGKKIKAAKEKPPKLVPVHISRGTFTVDGITGKAALNYDIPDLKYIYFFVPGIGTAIVSSAPFPGATEAKGAFNDRILAISVGDHRLELASDKKLIDKDKKPVSAYVKIDRDYILPSKFPVVGYGTLRVQPYQWPGSKANEKLAGVLEAPPLPKNMQPTLATLPCPKGQTRMPGPKPEPGKPAVTMPCLTAAQIAAAKDAGKKPEPTINYGR